MNTGNHAPESEVHTLKRQVDRHLSVPHEFVCITESAIDGVQTQTPYNNLQGWWQKVTLFSDSVSRTRNLWLDLDVTITQGIDALVEPLRGSQLRIAKNWAQSGHGGCQSSVMYWEGDSARVIYDEFDPQYASWPPRTDMFFPNGQMAWGDQEWVTVLRDTQRLQVEYFDPAHVISYKYHCQAGLPPDSLVQVFHGKPDPIDCEHIDWVKQCRA